jgi:hypothetical protein
MLYVIANLISVCPIRRSRYLTKIDLYLYQIQMQNALRYK